VKVKENDLQSAQLGDSEKLRVGQRVYAIGNPFGLAGGPSVTSGVVSAINRTIQSERGLIENLVQTDASINPGNSGGPLVDMAGKVVAINTAIIPYAQGIGFAIPINSAKICTDDILTEGATKKPWLGIVGLSITAEMARYYNLPIDHGVLVMKVAEGSPAEAADMVDGDIILRIGDVELHRIEDLVAQVRRRKAGESVVVFALRNGRERHFELKLREAP
jgi:S1-C subfamily serine protease